MKKPGRTPNVNKATAYAIVVNAIQIFAIVAFVLYVFFGPEHSHTTLGVIVLVAGCMAVYGASIDIQEALRTRRREHTISALQESNSQMDELNLALRAQRHDFLNHIQVVYGLLEMGEAGEAADYLERVYTQLRSVSKVMRTKLTAFNALLQVKSAACEERGIKLELDIRTTLEGLPVPAWEVCCIIGNLMDNAMDALQGVQDGHIRLEVREDLKRFTFTVQNNGSPIPNRLRSAIFEPGVSTKGEGRGMGLAIVKKTLADFGGDIRLEDSETTAFTVTVPRETPKTV